MDLDLRARLIIGPTNLGMNGLEFRQLLADARSSIALIFATACSDEAAPWQTFRVGTIDFLQESFREETLVQAREVTLGY